MCFSMGINQLIFIYDKRKRLVLLRGGILPLPGKFFDQ